MIIPKDIFAIGDSHATYCFREIREAIVKSVGSYTMHKVGRDQLQFKELMTPGCMVFFFFGEIDVRVHIYKQIQLGRNEDEIIETLISKYTEAIDKQKYNDVIPVIVSIVPPKRTNPDQMNYGTNKDRSRYCLKLNTLLEKSCILNNIDFLNIYDRYKDEEGLIRTELSDKEDGFHIGKSEMVIDEFHKFLERKRNE